MKTLTKLFYIILKVAVFTLVWFASFLILVLIAPTSENGTIVPAYGFVLVVAPFALAGAFMHPKLWRTIRSKFYDIAISVPQAKLPDVKIEFPKIPKIELPKLPEPKRDTTATESKPKLPLSSRKRAEAVQALIQEVNSEYSYALRAVSPATFIASWDSVLSLLDEIERYQVDVPASCFEGPITKPELEKNFQWKLRDAMERSIGIAIRDLKGEYHNNKNGRFADYKSSFERNRDRYDEETFDFARSAVAQVAAVAGIREFAFCGEPVFVEQPDVRKSSLNLDAVDFMNGHEFEHWCANLLTGIGFSDVRVTQGSGDQGVDVLAQKDGINYAIQCKCYSKDLGNTPIQEVNAGKTIYHCHIGVVMTNRHFTKGAKQAAAATGTLLWDRDWIADALKRKALGDSISL